MASAYRIPDTPGADVRPGATGFKTMPIHRMVPRSFITNLADGDNVKAKAPLALRGIAFGGDCGVARVELSTDGGENWRVTELGRDEGRYSFRRWTGSATAPSPGQMTVLVRCTNTNGATQPLTAIWNPAGFMRNVIERVRLTVA
jgi:hypothetical protein